MVHVLAGYPNDANLADEERFDEYDFEGIHVYRFHHAYTPMGGQVSMIEIGYDNSLAASYFDRILKIFQPNVVHFFHDEGAFPDGTCHDALTSSSSRDANG